MLGLNLKSGIILMDKAIFHNLNNQLIQLFGLTALLPGNSKTPNVTKKSPIYVDRKLIVELI